MPRRDFGISGIFRILKHFPEFYFTVADYAGVRSRAVYIFIYKIIYNRSGEVFPHFKNIMRYSEPFADLCRLFRLGGSSAVFSPQIKRHSGDAVSAVN